MKVLLSSHAVADLRRIGAFIAARSASFITELRETAKRLVDLPHGFPLVPRYERHGIRRRSWKGHGILYSVLPDHIFVHRILGPGQDYDHALRLN